MITYFISKIKKKLIKGLSGKAGRNNLGRVCVRGQGGGLKKKYRLIDIFRRLNSTGKVIKVFYDSNRTGRIALVLYLNSFCSFLLLQKGVKVNSVVYSGTLLCDNISMGYSMPLQHMPLFANISNLELIPFIGSTLCRAAGTSCMLVGKLKKETEGIIKLKSGWELHLSLKCISSYGAIAIQALNNIYIEKAGKNRALGWKPRVRGVAKNPCDHPHGGGNGKKPKPKIAVNAWHSVFKWAHTNNTKNAILQRRKYKKV